MALQRPLLRLLHTSDLHLGDDIDPQGRLDGLRAVVDAALIHQVAVVLIAGDLFDHARVREETVRSTLQELARLTMPTVVIPGNHDCVGEDSIYQRVHLRDAGDHIHFVGDPDGAHVVFPELCLSIWARGIEEHHPGHRPLEGYSPGGEPGFWHIALTHGHYVPSSEESDRSSAIREEEIAGLECEYVAMGHWHRFMNLSANGVAAFYSGSPSGGEVGDFPSANLVVLDPAAGVWVERLRL